MKHLKKIVVWLLIAAICGGFTGCGEPEAPATEPQATEPTGLQAPQDPAVIATVVTGEKTVQVKKVSELTAAVDATGNSQITLWQDITNPTAIRLPYSCTLDFNGHTVSASLDAGNGIQVSEAGSENTLTTLKNGKMTQYGVGIQVNKGALLLDGMTIHSIGGTPLALYDTNEEYRLVNRAQNCTLISGNSACLAFYQTGGDYENTGITLENTTLICAGDATPFSKIGTDTKPGTIILGDNVHIYGKSAFLAAEGFYYSGNMAPKSKEPQTVSADDSTWTDLYCWSTENPDDAINLLMIGNSFCYYFVQELYGVADAAGVDINVTNLYEAGCNVSEHWEWLTEGVGKNKYQFWITNSMGRWKHGDIRESYNALPYRDWDVITLQQHFGSGVKDYEMQKAKCVPYTKNLFDYLKENHPASALYWQTTWAYQVGHESMPSAAEQALRQDNIIKLSQELADESQVDVVPSGQAWKIARANPKVGDVLCRADLYHDGDVGGGQYLNACVWFEVLTGKSCIGNTWRPDNYKLSEEKIIELQKAAHQAVADMYGADYAK